MSPGGDGHIVSAGQVIERKREHDADRKHDAVQCINTCTKRTKNFESCSSVAFAKHCPSDGDPRIVDGSYQVKGMQTNHVMLLAISEVGNIYLSGRFSSRLSSLLQESSLEPLFGYDFALAHADAAEITVGTIKTNVGRLIMEVLIDASQMQKDVSGKLLHRLMHGYGINSFLVARQGPCLESEALSVSKHGDPVGIAAKALATKFANVFPGEEKYPCVEEDIEYVLNMIGRHRGNDLVAVSRRAMSVLKRGGYLDLKRTDVSMWFTKNNCYKTLASEDTCTGTFHETPPTVSVLCDSGKCSLQQLWPKVKKEQPVQKADGVVLYMKAGPQGEGIGDCPFAHYVRIALEEKGIAYELRSCTLYNKPQWLVEEHGGAMPALRHGDKSHVESEIIAQYIDYFFSEASLSPYDIEDIRQAKYATNEIFPALARYITHLPNGDAEDTKLRKNLENALGRLEAYLSSASRNATGPFLVGNGEQFTLVDASLSPKFYHMCVGLKAFKTTHTLSLVLRPTPMVRKYIKALFERPSFLKTKPKASTVAWGWANARNK